VAQDAEVVPLRPPGARSLRAALPRVTRSRSQSTTCSGILDPGDHPAVQPGGQQLRRGAGRGRRRSTIPERVAGLTLIEAHIAVRGARADGRTLEFAGLFLNQVRSAHVARESGGRKGKAAWPGIPNILLHQTVAGRGLAASPAFHPGGPERHSPVPSSSSAVEHSDVRDWAERPGRPCSRRVSSTSTRDAPISSCSRRHRTSGPDLTAWFARMRAGDLPPTLAIHGRRGHRR